jgi:outer membrane murein-binding lipoprotein Lpp
MKNLLLFAVISAAVLVNSGCSSKLMSFEKRRYNKGYHVDFAEKKVKRASASATDNSMNIPTQAVNEIITASNESTYSPLPEINTDNQFIEEATATVAETKKEKNKFFQNQVLKHFTKQQVKKSANYTLNKLTLKKNTANTNQTMQFNFFTFLGAVIAGGCLVALTVMLFSNWATVTMLILFVSGCFFGLILLIIGANT